jgi:hypothetical protein
MIIAEKPVLAKQPNARASTFATGLELRLSENFGFAEFVI